MMVKNKFQKKILKELIKAAINTPRINLIGLMFKVYLMFKMAKVFNANLGLLCATSRTRQEQVLTILLNISEHKLSAD